MRETAAGCGRMAAISCGSHCETSTTSAPSIGSRRALSTRPRSTCFGTAGRVSVLRNSVVASSFVRATGSAASAGSSSAMDPSVHFRGTMSGSVGAFTPSRMWSCGSGRSPHVANVSVAMTARATTTRSARVIRRSRYRTTPRAGHSSPRRSRCPNLRPRMETAKRHPQYGFVIDQRKCIGCHACTVACKAENEVPLGKFRTWVKYVDKGTFPSVRRHFTVLRCNHCDAAPCVEICPVNALHKRKDAIVDLDKDLCIGCRACMQACPYDALYLNEDTGTAEKCHYCAHRTELGLEPACVVVCPERAIVAGDVSNPQSGIAKLIASQRTSQRKLEKGTKPRVWYVDALPEALQPGETSEPTQWLWADRQVQPPPIPDELKPPDDVVTTLNAEHPPVWGWHIWTYLVTKNIAAGAGIVAPFLAMLGVAAGAPRDYVPETGALVFLGVTTFLI